MKIKIRTQQIIVKVMKHKLIPQNLLKIKQKMKKLIIISMMKMVI